jgi:hypothetical protein
MLLGASLLLEYLSDDLSRLIPLLLIDLETNVTVKVSLSNQLTSWATRQGLVCVSTS